MEMTARQLRKIVRSVIVEKMVMKKIRDPLNQNRELREMFLSFLEAYKKRLVDNVLAHSPDKYVQAGEKGEYAVEKGEKPGEKDIEVKVDKSLDTGTYDQQFQKRIVEIVDDKVDLAMGPFAMKLIELWGVLTTELSTQSK